MLTTPCCLSSWNVKSFKELRPSVFFNLPPIILPLFFVGKENELEFYSPRRIELKGERCSTFGKIYLFELCFLENVSSVIKLGYLFPYIFVGENIFMLVRWGVRLIELSTMLTYLLFLFWAYLFPLLPLYLSISLSLNFFRAFSALIPAASRLTEFENVLLFIYLLMFSFLKRPFNSS